MVKRRRSFDDEAGPASIIAYGGNGSENAGEEEVEQPPRTPRASRTASARSPLSNNAKQSRLPPAKLSKATETSMNESSDGADDIVGKSDDEDSNGSASPTDKSAATVATRKFRTTLKRTRRQRTPTPPRDLPPHENFFFQNRAGGMTKTSTATFSSHLLLDHDRYATQIQGLTDAHYLDMVRLTQLHRRSFDQWKTELDEGFNLCLYGYGSKRSLVMEFISLLAEQDQDQDSEASSKPITIVVNGYSPTLVARDVLSCIAGVLLPPATSLPAQPAALLERVCVKLDEYTNKVIHTPVRIRLVIHSIDHANLRKTGVQAMIARLAASRHVSIIATCDTPNFSLQWHVSLLRQYRFAFHDATTFNHFKTEMDVVQDVNALLGRGSRRLGGKDGVGHVLKSLPENARSLFRLLVAEQLALLENDFFDPSRAAADSEWAADDVIGTPDEDTALLEQNTPTHRGKTKPKPKPKKSTPSVVTARARPRPTDGVEYRTLYHKSVEEFICSSELNFRTLLKEFHDHQMIESQKDIAGSERLMAPFSKQDLEAILEDLV